MDCPEILHGNVFDHADSDFVIEKFLTLTVLMLLPVYGKRIIRLLFFIDAMDFSKTFWTL